MNTNTMKNFKNLQVFNIPLYQSSKDQVNKTIKLQKKKIIREIKIGKEDINQWLYSYMTLTVYITEKHK